MTFNNILKTVANDAIHYSDATTLAHIASIVAEKNKRKNPKWIDADLVSMYKALEPTYYHGPREQLVAELYRTSPTPSTSV